MTIRSYGVAAVAMLCGGLLAGCTRGCSPPKPATVRLATTTSVENSGLLNVLLPAFRNRTGIEVQVMSMGTGRALAIARNGDCDVVLVHDPRAEETFIHEGWGVDRRLVMYNDFVIVGPPADSAGIRGAASAVEALRKIAESGSTFVSRGDNSGTHEKEKELWQAGGLEPSGKWYCSVGAGMGEAIVMANERRAYVLTDRGTFLQFRSKIDLAVLVEGGKVLTNPYHVIAVNPARHFHVKYEQAMKFVEFLTCEEGQRLIGGYKVNGEVLFHPWREESRLPAAAGIADHP